MTTGWKSILLKPVDPFFSKHGAGTELPFKITGTREAPHFGLDFHHKGERSKKDERTKEDEHPKEDHATESRRQSLVVR